jgi:MFS family permease
MLAAGVVFGFAAIKPVLKAEGAYRRACAVPDDAPVDGNTCVEMHLNLMFTVAAVVTNIAALPVGAILDHYGPRVCSIIGSLFLAIGALLMAWESIMPFDGLFLGYLLLALGSPFIYISSFQLSNAFPRHSGFILALLTGAFDASSALFLVYRLVWQATNGALNQAGFFSLYLFVPASIILLQFILMPAQSYKTAGELIEALREPLEAIEEIDSRPVEAVNELTAFLHEEDFQEQVDVIEGIQDVLGPAKARPDEQLERETHRNDISGVWGVMHGLPAHEQLKSFWFVLICLFTGAFPRLSPLPFSPMY